MKAFTSTFFLLCSLILVFSTSSFSQCLVSGNTNGIVAAPTSLGNSTTISSCTNFGENSTITALLAGNSYSLNATNTSAGFITIFASGSTSSIASGPLPFVFTPATTGNYTVQWNDTLCGSDAICHLTTISLTSISLANSYCTSQATSTSDEDILGVSLSNLINTSTCGTTGTVGSILNCYSNFTNISPAILTLGNTYPLSVTVGTCSGAYNSVVKVWIDYNQDGDFNDPGEQVLASSSAQVGNYTVSANIVVPSAATTGLTRMRVVNVETSYMFLSSVTPCGTYFWGETEDYMVQIGAPNTYSCVSGTVFCDIDTNGIYNGSDMFLDSVPVSFNYNGQSQFISTAANGTYSFVFPLDSLVTSATVSLDTAWLAQNGVIASPFSISTTQLVCNTSSSQLNFPVNCDALIIAGNCTSPFLAGNVVSSVINACPDVDFDLTLSGGSPGNGITYQWQISPDSLTFTNIAGATNDTFLGMQSTGMYYRCIAICTNTYFGLAI